MSADDHLGVQFHPADEDYPRHLVSSDYGELNWHPQTGEITLLRVDTPGRGVATAMYNHAKRISGERGIQAPQHSSFRSPAGDAWAQSTGDYVPPLDEKAKSMAWLDPRQQRR